MKSFGEKCYDLLRQVPRGRVTTYGEIARALGCSAFRAVGSAMNKNPYPYVENQRFSPGSETEFSDNLFFRDTRLPKEKSKMTCSARNVSPIKDIRVPCHRVVGSGGKIGGFAHGVSQKIDMLKGEGVDVVDGKVVCFDEIFYRFGVPKTL